MKLKRREVKAYGWLQTHRAGAGVVAIILAESQELAAELFAAAFGPRHDCTTYRLPDRWAEPGKASPRWGEGLDAHTVYIAGGLFVHWSENAFFPWAKYRTLQKNQAGAYVYPKAVVQ